MKHRFYIKRPKGDTETAIYARISHNMKQIRIYTGYSCLPKYWNPKRHRAKSTPSFGEASSLNVRLDKMQTLINQTWLDYVNKYEAEPSLERFKKMLDQALGRSKEIKYSFYEYFQDFIRRTGAGQRQTGKGKIVSPIKARMYGTTLKKLQEFNSKLDFDGINLDFYNDFTVWLRKKGFAENNVGGHIQRIKAVLNEATEREVNTNLAFRSKRFISVSEEVDNIALSETELQEVQELDLSKSPHLDRVRDMFLIGCHTGLRYSDYSRLTPENIKGGFIEITQQKTGNPVAIPVHSVVEKIIKKYDGNLPESISNQKTNAYLKDICKEVKSLQKPASKTRTQGGMKITVNYQKWEIVSSHTARRTFATNAYLQNIPTVTIMAITGHKTEKAFLKYIKVTPKEHAKIMEAHWAKKKMKVAK